MPIRFMAIKIHYDHRAVLPHYLKYSKLPSREEYDEYLDLYKTDGIGGEGFHECLNFQIPADGNVKIYLPPTSLPSIKKMNDEFVIFSFTYKEDQEMPDHLIGVHANVSILDKDGINRPDSEQLDGIYPFIYHAQAPAEFVTLVTPPLEYGREDGMYTPVFEKWGFGLRYITEDHAKNIVKDALQGANQRIEFALDTEKMAVARQIEVLERIANRHFPELIQDETEDNYIKGKKTKGLPPVPPLPDKELGLLGERLVYEREIAFAIESGVDPIRVEWISQAVPTSPFDIKTIRKTSKGYRDHYLEVKSSRMDLGANVFISSNQIEFFEEHPDAATFVFVNFDNQNLPEVPFCELTLSQLLNEYELVPLKYKLKRLN